MICRAGMVCVLILLSAVSRAEETSIATTRPVKLPEIQINAEAFGASESDIRAVLSSVEREMAWAFADEDEPRVILVRRSRTVPITLFERGPRGQIVVELATEHFHWSQYAYQFAHELSHVACRTRRQGRQNLWFEETLCETASLYSLRAMARRWREEPPFPNWRDYHDALRDYADQVIRSRASRLDEIARLGLGGFYRAHQAELETNPANRELNGAMAVVLLNDFEADPQNWAAVHWLNATEAPQAESFEAYLRRWHEAAGPRRRGFVEDLTRLYEQDLPPAATQTSR